MYVHPRAEAVSYSVNIAHLTGRIKHCEYVEERIILPKALELVP